MISTDTSNLSEVLPGVIAKPLKRFIDARGWLTELFRDDELPEGFSPTMGYLSLTHPGVARLEKADRHLESLEPVKPVIF